MKVGTISLLMILVFFTKCNSLPIPTIPPVTYQYNYSASEMELMSMTNDYRQGLGLTRLVPLPHIGYLCHEHNLYMINKDTLNHDYFEDRQNSLILTFNATEVGEVLASGYKTNQSTLTAWINSLHHRPTIIRPSYTNIGVSITECPITQTKYYTLIFIKK